MPLEIDPAWEYYCGDSEVEDILRSAARGYGFSALGLEYHRIKKRRDNRGFRFGTGFKVDQDKSVNGLNSGRGAGPWRTDGSKLNESRFRRLWEHGITRGGISWALGIHDNTIWVWKKRFGLKSRPIGGLPQVRRHREVLFQEGSFVRLNVPENPRLHLAHATIKEIKEWGAFVETPAAATGEFRALWSEMLPYAEVNGKLRVAAQAKDVGYSGEACEMCGSFRMKRSGTCQTCEDCGANTGCT